LKRTSGRLARADCACSSCATNSLPVPVSPRTSTVTSRLATRAVASSSRRIGRESPTIRRPSARSAASVLLATRSARASSARSITCATSSMSNGLVR
jgi:hypothetical protein